ncbi:MAG: RIP metalloprotease RseP [Prevotella sp.]|nr:RIP metalloprotease RseP [Prevotella sp.]MCM1074421.1 RIP metalloprotease RseP [Ruminococcus sp.]
METFLIKAAQLILAFAILVIIHEFGHFLFARLFGVKVEKFYIFFDPWFELAKWKPKKYFAIFGKKKKLKEAEAEAEKENPENLPVERKSFWGNTEYGIGWLPLGGYCKISGMIDESMDTEQMKQPPKPWEFRTKPAWQRLLIMTAGVLFNFLLAILIYAGITWWWGDDHVAPQDTKGLLKYSEVAQKAGFQDGDIPLTADGKPITNLAEDMFDLGDAKQVTVLRNDKDTMAINLPANFMMDLETGRETDKRGIAFVEMDIPVVIHSIANESSRKAGLREGDEIIGVNGKLTKGATEFLPSLEGKANETVDITVVRNDKDTLNIPVKLDSSSKIGFQLENDLRKLFNVTTEKYGFFESFPVGIAKGSDKMVDYVSSLKYVFTKEGAQSVGGFGAIGSMFPDSWNWYAFWNIAAFLSVALAFMNILPIPGLDGGHVMFLLYEVIFRRKPSDKFMEYAQITGMVLLILLLLYANGMDIVRLFK